METPLTISHVVVNVGDLGRSVSFYEETTPLCAGVRFAAPEQTFTPFGIGRAALDGVVMTDSSLGGGPAVHLVEWKEKPVGLSTYSDFTAVGLFRMCFQSEEVEKIHGEVVSAGVRPFTPPLKPVGERRVGRPVFSFPDPDGVVIEYVTRPGPTRLYHVNCNCSDLTRSSAFYDALGLLPHAHMQTTTPVVFSFSGNGPAATCDAALYTDTLEVLPDGRPRFVLDLVQWKSPQSTGRPYASQMNPGIVRMAIVPADFRAAHEALAAVTAVSAVATMDYGGEIGCREYFVARDPDGVVIEVLDRPVRSVTASA